MTPATKIEVDWFKNSLNDWLDTSKANDAAWVAQLKSLSADAINEITINYGLNYSYQVLLTVSQVNELSQKAVTFIVTTLRDSISVEDKHALTASTLTKMFIGLNARSSWALDGGNSWLWQITKEQVQQLSVQGGVALYKLWTNNNKVQPNYGDKNDQKQFKDQIFVNQFRALSSEVINDLIEYENGLPAIYQALLSVDQINNLSQFAINAIYANLRGFISNVDVQNLTPNAVMKMLSSLNEKSLSPYDNSNQWIRQLTEEQVSQLDVSGGLALYSALVKDITANSIDFMSAENQALFVKLIQWINPDTVNEMMAKQSLLSVVLNHFTADQLYACSSDAIYKQLLALNATTSWAGDGQNKWIWKIREADVSQLSNECSIELFKAFTNKYTNDVYGQNIEGKNYKDEIVAAQFRSLNGHVINALILEDKLAVNFAGLMTTSQIHQLTTQAITTELKKLNKVSWVGGLHAVGAWVWNLTDAQVSKLGVEGGVALYKAWTQANKNLLYVQSKTSGNFNYQTAISQFRALSGDVISALIANKFDVDLRYDYQRLITVKQLNGLSQEDIKSIYPTLRSSIAKEDVQTISVSKLHDMLIALDSVKESWAGDGASDWLWHMTKEQVSQFDVKTGLLLYKIWSRDEIFFDHAAKNASGEFKNQAFVTQFKALNSDVINALIVKKWGLDYWYKKILSPTQINGVSQNNINKIYSAARDSLTKEEVSQLSVSTLTSMLFVLNDTPGSWAGDGKNGWLWGMTDGQVSQLGVEAGVQLYKAWTNKNTDFGYGDNQYKDTRVPQQFRSLSADVINAIVDKRYGYGMHWSYQRLLTVNQVNGLSTENINLIYPTLRSLLDINTVIPNLSTSTLSNMLIALNAIPGSWAGEGQNGWLWYITDAQVSQLGVEAGFQLYKAWTNNNTDFRYGDNVGGEQLENTRIRQQFKALSSDVINAIIDKRFGYGMHWSYQRLLTVNQVNGLSTANINLIYPTLRSQSVRNADVPKLSTSTLSNMLVALHAIPGSWAGEGQNGWLWYITDAQVSQLGIEAGVQLYRAWTNNNTDFRYGDNVGGEQLDNTRIRQQFKALSADVINAIIDKRFGYGMHWSYQRLLTANQVNGLSTANINLIYPTLRSQSDINADVPKLSTSTLSNMLVALHAIPGSWAGEGQNGWLWYITDAQVSQLGVEAGFQLYRAWTNNNTDFGYGDNVGGTQYENKRVSEQFRALNADVINAIIDKRFGYGMHWSYQRLLTANQVNGLSTANINLIYPTLRSQSDINADVPKLSTSTLSNMLVALHAIPGSWAGEGQNGWLWYITDAQVSQLGVEAGFQLYRAWTNNNTDFGYGDNVGGTQYENKRVSEQFRALNADVINAIINKRFGNGMHLAYQRLLTTNHLDGLSKESINLIYPTLRSQLGINTVIPNLSTSTLSNMLFALNAIPGSWAGDGQNGWLWYITDAQVSQLGVEAGFQLYRAWTNNNTDFGYGDNVGGTQYENKRVSEQFRALNADVINAIINKRFGNGMHLAYQRLLTTNHLDGLSKESINLIYPTLRSQSVRNADVPKLSTSTLSNMLFALNAIPGSWAGDGQNGWLWYITDAQVSQLGVEAGFQLYRAWTNNNTDFGYGDNIGGKQYDNKRVSEQFRALSADVINAIIDRRFGYGMHLGYQKLLTTHQLSGLSDESISLIYPKIRNSLTTSDIESLPASIIDKLINAMNNDPIRKNLLTEDTWIWNIPPAKISQLSTNESAILFEQWYSKLGDTEFIKKISKNSQGAYNDPTLVSQIRALSAASIMKVNRFYRGERLKALSVNQIEALGSGISYACYFVAQSLSIDELQSLSLDAINYILQNWVLYLDKSWISAFAYKLKDNQLDKCDFTSPTFNEWADDQSPDRLAKIGALTIYISPADMIEDDEIDLGYRDLEEGIRSIMIGRSSGVGFFKFLLVKLTTKLGSVQLVADFFIRKNFTLPSTLRLMRVEHINSFSPELFKLLNAQSRLGFLELTGGQITAMDDEHTKIYVHYLNNNWSTDYYSTTIIEKLSPIGFVNLDFTRLSPQTIRALNKEKVAAITGAQFVVLRLEQLSQFSPLQVSWISNATIQDMGLVICKLTPDQLRGITHSQATYVNKTQWMSFRPEQKGILATNVGGSLNANVLNSFTDPEIKVLTPQQFTWISLNTIKKLSADLISKLSPKQIWAMSPEQMSALGPEKARLFNILTFQGMGKLQWEALNKSPGSGAYPSLPIFAMNKAQLQNITLENLSLIPPSSIALLTDENLGALTSLQCLALTTRQYMALSENQKKCLTTKPIVITAGNQIANISPEKLALLPAEIIQTLNIIQFRSLSTSQVQSLTNDQMQSLLGLMLNGLTAEDIKRFSRIQVDAINVSQLLEVNEATQNLILSRMSASASTIASKQIANQKAVLGNYDPVSRAYKTPLISSTAFRNLYSTATASRTFAAFKFNMTTFEVEAKVADIARFEKAEFFKDFKATIDATRSRQQGLRMISTLWSLFGVASAFSRAATYDQRNGNNVSSNVVQGLAWLASALQVPWATLYSAFAEASKAERLFLERNPLASQDEIRNVRNVAWEQSFQKEMGGKTIVTDYVNRIAGVPATKSETEILPVASENVTLGNNTYRSINGDAVRVEPAPKLVLYSDTFSFSDFKNMKLLSGDKIWENFKASGGIFLVANIMNVMNYSFNIRDTRFDNSLKDDVRTARIVMQSLGLGGAVSLLAADLISLLAVDSAAVAATAGAARASAALSMVGFGLIVASTSALTIYNDVKNLQKESTDGAKVALALDCVGTFFQLALLVGCLAAAGPVGAGVMLVMALIPNWGSVGSAIDLANKQRELDSQGRYAEGDIICYHLHQIAALNATPIVNLGSAIYTPIIMEQIYTKMTNGGFLQALQENYSYYINNDKEDSAGKKVVNEIMGNMKTAFNYRVDTDPYLTNMRYINVDFAAPKDYYANGPAKSFYWSMLDVQCDQNGDLKAVTDLQWITSTVFINDRAKNSTEVISIASANSTEQVITVDARGSTQDMIFYVMLDACIVYGGSGKNSYIINTDNLVSTGYQIYDTGTGATINDTVQYIGKINTAQINLDNIHNAYVKGTEYQNNVWATQSEKSYQYAGGIDSVTLLGGKSSASIGGRGNYLRMEGGNNTAYAVLGFSAQSNLAEGFYNGGATTLTKDAKGQIVGLNTLNFSGSCLALDITVVDPNSSTYSSAATLHDNFNDIARFTNFHNLVGTSFGDNIKINNTTNIDQVVLGAGNNDVTVNNSKGVSIISGDSYQNKIYLNNSDVAVASNTGSVEVNVGQNTKLYSILNGVSDVINAKYADNYFVYNGLMESGSHTIHLNQGTASITVLPDVENSTTFVYEESTQRDSGHLLNLTLGEKFEDALFRMDDDGVYFLGKDNASQELNYFVDEATTLYNTDNRKAADITKYVSISSSSLQDSVIALNLLIQASASMSSATSATTTNKGHTYFNLSDVATVVKNQYSAIT